VTDGQEHGQTDHAMATSITIVDIARAVSNPRKKYKRVFTSRGTVTGKDLTIIWLIT